VLITATITIAAAVIHQIFYLFASLLSVQLIAVLAAVAGGN
jgi:hypothetical protein